MRFLKNIWFRLYKILYQKVYINILNLWNFHPYFMIANITNDIILSVQKFKYGPDRAQACRAVKWHEKPNMPEPRLVARFFNRLRPIPSLAHCILLRAIIIFFYQRVIKCILLPRAGQTNPFFDPPVEKKSRFAWASNFTLAKYSFFSQLHNILLRVMFFVINK